MNPEIIVCGKSRSGKDTFAELMAKYIDVVPVAMADPMKRFCMEVFDFSYETLWGPSELRNAPDMRYVAEENDKIALDAILDAAEKLVDLSPEFISSLFPDKDPEFHSTADVELETWFDALGEHAENGLQPRVALQTLGTEFGRTLYENVWVDYAGRIAQQLLKGGWVYNKATGLIRSDVARCPDAVVITDGRFPNEVLAVKRRGGIAIKVVNPEQPNTTVGIAGHASETAQDAIPDRWFDAIVMNDKRLGLPAFESKVRNVVDSLLPVSRF
jgi:predicted Zn-dependent protease with MMP-like domain